MLRPADVSVRLCFCSSIVEEPPCQDAGSFQRGLTPLINGFYMSSSDDETISINGASGRKGGDLPAKLQRVGDYELLEVVAQGGMGVVYRARQVSLNRFVAVKMIRQFEFASESDRIRFKAEAEAAAALSHPNTVPIYEVGEQNGIPYFSMRLIEGGSLANQLASGDWPIDSKETIRKAVQLMSLVAMAVHDAHQHGIIHRDLKPGNILLDEVGLPFVADFGLAKRFSNRDQVTQTGSIVGTPAFMSPEQAAGKDTTIASDLYSLGAILYNLIGGRPPIQADTPMELFNQLMNVPAKPVRKWNRLVDKDLETICQKCLEKDPSRRYSSARSLADDLQNWQAGKPISARPTGPVTQLYRWSKRNPMNVAISGLAFALGLVIVGTLALGYLSTRNAIRGFKRERYANRIAQASAAFEDGSPIDAEVYLAKELPRPDQDDLRGWEWYYLQRKSPVEYSLGKNYWLASWSPDGAHFATHVTDPVDYRKRTVSVWRYPASDLTAEVSFDSILAEPALLSTTQTEPNSAANYSGQMVWDPTGRYLGSHFQTNALQIWDTRTQSLHSSVAWNIAEPWRAHFQWSGDGQRLALVDHAGHIQMYSMDTKQTIDWTSVSLLDSNSVVTSIAWGPADKWLAVSESLRTHFVDPTTQEISATWPVSILGWNQDRTRWMCSHGIGDVDSEKILIEVNLSTSSVWSPDGRWIASAEGDRIVIIDSISGKSVQEYFVRNAMGLVWFPSSERLLVSGRVLRNLSWSPNDLEITLDKPITVMETSRDGSQVAIVGQDSNQIQVLDSKGAVQSTFSGHSTRVLALDWRHDDESIASLDVEGKVRVWNVRDGSESLALTLTDGEIPKQVNTVDWQVHWSPHDELIAASAAGSIIRVWEPEHGSVKGQLDKRNSRIIGWMKEPLSLNIQIYGSSSLIFPRQRNTPNLELSNICRVINWDVLKNSLHTYSTAIMASSTSTPCAWPDDGYYYSISQYDNGISRDTLESPERYRGVPFFSDSEFGLGPFSQIELADPPARIFSLSTNGTLELNDVDRKATLLRLPKCSKDSHLSYASSKLWVAEGKKLRLFDASSNRMGNIRRRTTVANLASEIPNQLTVSVLFSILVLAPIWIVADPGIRMSLSRRWMIAVFVGASAAFMMSQYNYSIYLNHMTWKDTEREFLVILAILIAAGVSAFLVESLRLVSLGRWVLPLLLWLCVALGALLIVGYIIWPSAWQLDRDPTGMLLSSVVLPAGLATFAIGTVLLITRFQSGAYSASLHFRRAPFWVKWSLWGCKSTRSAIVITSIESLFYSAIVFGGLALPPPLKWILVGIAIIAMMGPVVRIFAIRWILRNGGWNAQLDAATRST